MRELPVCVSKQTMLHDQTSKTSTQIHLHFSHIAALTGSQSVSEFVTTFCSYQAETVIPSRVRTLFCFTTLYQQNTFERNITPQFLLRSAHLYFIFTLFLKVIHEDHSLRSARLSQMIQQLE